MYIYMSVLYKHIIQVEKKNVGLKVCVCGGGGGTNIPLPLNKKVAPLPPPASLFQILANFMFVCLF